MSPRRPGPRPVPTETKKRRGNPGRRALNDKEPIPVVAIPHAPDHVKANKVAHLEWKRVTPQLRRLRLITLVDRTALAAYCLTYARWVEAEQALAEFGMLVKSPNDYPMPSPWLAISNKALEQCRAFLQEFGFTPSARTSVHAISAEDTSGDLEEFDLD